MKKNKKQLHEALAVLLTKLSSAMDNPLLMDNYVVKALRTVLRTDTRVWHSAGGRQTSSERALPSTGRNWNNQKIN